MNAPKDWFPDQMEMSVNVFAMIAILPPQVVVYCVIAGLSIFHRLLQKGCGLHRVYYTLTNTVKHRQKLKEKGVMDGF